MVQGFWGILFAVEGLRAVAAVPSTSKTIPQDPPNKKNIYCVFHLWYTLYEILRVGLKRVPERMGIIGNFGFIHEKIEIKVLILFVLRRLQEPVTLDVLTELTMCDGGISYFDFTDCVAELVKTGHVRFEDDKYSLTRKGERNGEITESNLPYSVRAKAENSAGGVRSAQNRNALIKTSSECSPDGGCEVFLSLSDGIGDIVSIKLFAANEQQARALENGFRKNAEGIYNALIELII